MGVILGSIMWMGLFQGFENTSAFPRPFQQPGISSTTAIMLSVAGNTVRIGYIHPLQRDGYGPALQIGVSRKIF